MVKSRLQEATVADFSGGWNVADSPLNLSSTYQVVSDNIIRGINGSFAVRWGTQLFADARLGTVETPAGTTLTFSVTNLQPWISVTHNGHPYSEGDHITIPDTVSVTSGTLGGIPLEDLIGVHEMDVTDANHYRFAVRHAATSSDTGTLDITGHTIDDHELGGNIIHMQPFQQVVLLFTDIGEVAAMEEDGTITRIWDVQTAIALSGNPPGWRHCDLVSSTTFKSTVIAVNGYDKDKPIQITEDLDAEYLVDKASNVNTHVPRADFVVAMQKYVALLRTETAAGNTAGGAPFIAFSAQNTDGTFSGEAVPEDATEVDLSMITDTVDPTILGGAVLRDKLYVAFRDRGMLGTLGVYNSDGDHVPDFNDTIAENGTVSHRTMVSLGNDVFLADYAGVPSVSISSQTGGFVPVRLSELIGPEIQKHLASLSENTLRNKAYAIYNRSDRMYMLMVPIYDEDERDLEQDPFLFNDDLKELNQAICFARNHKLFENSSVSIAGATDIGSLVANNINGQRRVVSIINENSFVIQLGGNPAEQSTIAGGGSSVTLTPVNDETICYGFEYNKELRIKRWTRLRGWQFDCGCVTKRGRVYFARQGRVYRYGSSEEPLYADLISNYDYRTWDDTQTYTVGEKVYDINDKRTYICLIEHDADNANITFAEFRTLHPDLWEEYEGEPINWACETPWSDLSQRSAKKHIKNVKHDTEGAGLFDFSIFTNRIERHPQTYALAPARTMQFSGGDVGGYGMLDPATWGAGRRTREEHVWPMPCTGQLFKLRWSGATRDKLRVTSATLLYLSGSVKP